MNDRVTLIQQLLAERGTIVSYNEIEDIFNVLSNVSLKIIVTHVPKAVYHNDVAKNAFESVFIALDSNATFVYLPSFSRVMVYVSRPEAAIFARLQTQGWKLPDDVLAQLPDSFPVDPEGIRCYIDHAGDLDSSLDMEEEDPESYCQCGILESEGTDESRVKESEVRDTVSGTPLSTVPPIVGDKPGCSVLADVESTSEASGDDRSAPIVQICAFCQKTIRSTGQDLLTKRRMKLLAPPKPQRQYLLSPPASPPDGWEPSPEAEPIINYDLLEALACLAPGESFELHPGNEASAHPSIVVVPCESTSSDGGRPHGNIVQTRCPERDA